MKIAKVTCWVLEIPFQFPMRKPTKVRTTFLEIETDDGLKGHALSTTPMRWGIREYVNREAAPEMIGMDPMCTEAIRRKLYWTTAVKYFMGAWNCAMSMIDIALWDIRGKATGQPIWKLLGGANPELPAYVTFGPPWYELDELVEMAKKLVGEGHTALKMVVGANGQGHDVVQEEPTEQSIRRDAHRVRTIRETIGPDIGLMVDANKSMSPAYALYLAKEFEPLNLTWFEDPVLNGDPRLTAELRRKTTVPIAAGSTGTSDLQYFREYLLLDAVDYIQPNVRDIGGYTQGIKAAALAKAFNIPMSMGGNYPHINMHLHGGVPNGGRIEFHLQGWSIANTLFDGCPGTADGKVVLPEAPGLGFTPKDGFLDLAVD